MGAAAYNRGSRLVAREADGMPTREIAARAGLSPTTVGKIARAAGMRRQGGRPRKGEAARPVDVGAT